MLKNVICAVFFLFFHCLLWVVIKISKLMSKRYHACFLEVSLNEKPQILWKVLKISTLKLGNQCNHKNLPVLNKSDLKAATLQGQKIRTAFHFFSLFCDILNYKYLIGSRPKAPPGWHAGSLTTSLARTPSIKKKKINREYKCEI